MARGWREDGESNDTSDDDTDTSLDDEDEESSVTSDDEPDTSLDDDVSNAAAQMCVAAQTLASMVITSSSHSIGTRTRSSAPSGKMTTSSDSDTSPESNRRKGPLQDSLLAANSTTVASSMMGSNPMEVSNPMPSKPVVSSFLLHFLPRAAYGSRLPILPDRDPGATHYWSKRTEFRGHIIKMSTKDGKPHITNSNNGKKLRVGVWDNLDDLADHEARHAM